MATTEHALLNRLHALDIEALAEVYDTYNTALYRYAYRLLGDTALAEDCTTETFSRLLKALREGAGPSQYLKAYLFRTAHNWVTDQFRARGNREVSLDELSEAASELRSDAPSPAQLSESAYEAGHVRGALALLTAEQRLVIVMKFFEDMSNEEIASALGKPIGAIKSLQHRALDAMRRALAHVIEVPA